MVIREHFTRRMIRFPLCCFLCRRRDLPVHMLFRGPSVFICTECVEESGNIHARERGAA